MSFHVYNSLTKRKEAFRSLEPNIVRMYNCGPTVYSRAHIGNFRAYLFADTLRRWLEHQGFEVRQVMNITDVGHLTDDDAGEGEDKIEAQARREGRDPFQISRGYTELFMQDLARLECERAMVYPRASEHVPEMLDFCKKNLQNLSEGPNSFGHWHYTYLYYSQVMYRQGEKDWAPYRDRLCDRIANEQHAIVIHTAP